MAGVALVALLGIAGASAVASRVPEKEPLKQAQGNLTILTDEALILPLTELSRAYAQEAHTPLTVVVKSDSGVDRQVEQGLEAHLIISSDTALLDRLGEQGLTDVNSRQKVTAAALALIGTPAQRETLNAAERLSLAAMLHATRPATIFTTDLASPDGAQVAKLLMHDQLADLLSARLVRLPSVEEVLVSTHEADALALVLAPRVVQNDAYAVLRVLPEDVSPPVRFEGLVLASERMHEAGAFLRYLSSPPAQDIFRQFGYQAR